MPEMKLHKQFKERIDIDALLFVHFHFKWKTVSDHGLEEKTS